MEHAPGLYLVEGPASNWVIARDGQDFTLVDSGYPADLPILLDSIAYLGLDPARAAAILITHGHTDHTGGARHFSTQYGTPVYCSAGEYKTLLGEEKFQVDVRKALPYLWRPKVIRWAIHATRAGGTITNDIPAAAIFDSAVLEKLPGAPQAVETPGHTPGHCVFYFQEARALASGDALVSGHMISQNSGPQMLHPMFHHELDKAVDSLELLPSLDVNVVLPGHGPAIRGNLADLIRNISR
ncbi:MBL fold metallo-hydrolase [Arthrobacter sp. A2-55]|uniref:MBL fold metallo-hydrolase n=1 Tax=Arthrobacter sp. A2-55 TaxID=2897337 RepID=UPI0021CDBD1C|nr:MBL fold metallo-hydrolase [Arthrobacter sp. A2-55]MCU6481289.1 MBL fold metallo-hydrolase [Arthrobacter sp. A2-55]